MAVGVDKSERCLFNWRIYLLECLGCWPVCTWTWFWATLPLLIITLNHWHTHLLLSMYAVAESIVLLTCLLMPIQWKKHSNLSVTHFSYSSGGSSSNSRRTSNYIFQPDRLTSNTSSYIVGLSSVFDVNLACDRFSWSKSDWALRAVCHFTKVIKHKTLLIFN